MKTVLLLGGPPAFTGTSVRVHSDRDICPCGPLGPVYKQVSKIIDGELRWFGVEEGDESKIESLTGDKAK